MRCKYHTSCQQQDLGFDPAMFHSRRVVVARGPPALQSVRNRQQKLPARSSKTCSAKQPRRVAARASLGTANATRTMPGRAGWSFLAIAINIIFQFPPLYKLLMGMAKKSMIRTAEQHGITWSATVDELQSNKELHKLQRQVENASVTYPDYYKLRFHAYDEGNLGWLPAFEAESGTDDMALRAMGRHMTPAQAQDGLRQNAMDAIQGFMQQHCGGQAHDILDVGCSVGVSTRYLAQAFPQASSIVGLDLSSYFLAVAQLRSSDAVKQGATWPQHISYMHASAEASGLPSESFDLINFGFILHECPVPAIRTLLLEARRLLRKGGVIAITDNDPGAQHRREAKPAHVMVLLKVIEPWEADFIAADLEGMLVASGFGSIRAQATDSRHRTVMAQA